MTGGGETAAKASMQKCPAIEVMAKLRAPAAFSRSASLAWIASCAAVSPLAWCLRRVGVSACAIVNSSGRPLAAREAIRETGGRRSDADDQADMHRHVSLARPPPG